MSANVPVTDHVVTLLPRDDARTIVGWTAECTCGEHALSGTEAQMRRWKLKHIKGEWAKRNRAGWYHPQRRLAR